MRRILIYFPSTIVHDQKPKLASPHPPTLLVRRKINKTTRRIFRGATQVSVGLASVQGFLRLSLSAVAPENLVSRDGLGSPVARQPAHLHTQAESGAYLRDSSRVPRRRPFIYLKTTTRHRVSPEFIGSCIIRTNGVHCREFVGTGPVSLKVVPNECCLGRSPWTNK